MFRTQPMTFRRYCLPSLTIFSLPIHHRIQPKGTKPFVFHKFIIKEFSISVIFHHNLLKWEISSKRTRRPFLYSRCWVYRELGHKLLQLLFSRSAFLFKRPMEKRINLFVVISVTNASTRWRLKIIYPRGNEGESERVAFQWKALSYV